MQKELLEIASLIPGGGDESPWSTVAKVVAAGIARGHSAEGANVASKLLR